MIHNRIVALLTVCVQYHNFSTFKSLFIHIRYQNNQDILMFIHHHIVNIISLYILVKKATPGYIYILQMGIQILKEMYIIKPSNGEL